jgi:hypothetical protein
VPRSPGRRQVGPALHDRSTHDRRSADNLHELRQKMMIRSTICAACLTLGSVLGAQRPAEITL